MIIKDLTNYLEEIAPLKLQESYDNCGLLTGSHEWPVNGVLCTLDCTEEVVKEAKELGCNVIIAHHPIIFGGLKKLNGYNYVEKTIIAAIKNDIAIYAWHTNLDNVHNGVNAMIAKKLELIDCEILRPKNNLMKMVTFIPVNSTDEVMNAVFESGAGKIGNYSACSFKVLGTGTFTPEEGAKPTVGNISKAEEVKENRVELMFPAYLQKKVLTKLKEAHPYDEVAYYLQNLVNDNQDQGSGMIGKLKEKMTADRFLAYIKEKMGLNTIKYTALEEDRPIQQVAVCGGAGKFLLADAKDRGADAFISSDFTYHEYFDAEGKIMIADIGHYESEVYTKDLIFTLLKENFTTFAVHLSKRITNPISYY